MKQKYGTRFFTPLLPGFTKKLLMPQELAKNIGMDDTRGVATIVTSGKIWPIEFYKVTKDYYIGGKGWENFVEAHGLKDYEMLVFRYRGNMVFSLRIFDKVTCCEKIYQHGSRTGVRENTVFPDHDDDDKSSVVKKQTKSSCKKRKVHDTEENNMATLSQDKVPAETEGNCSAKLSFETTIKAYHLSRRRVFMDIPSEFIQSSGREHGEFMLGDPQGQTWPVSLSKCKLFGAYVSKGWLEFARGNKLKEGDRCIFELSASSSQQRKKRLINFKILSRMTPIRQTGQTRKMPKSAPEDSESPENRETLKKTTTRAAQFEVTLTTRWLSCSYMYIPKRFQVATCLGKLSGVTLIDPKCRRWPIRLRHTHSRPYFGGKIRTDTYLTTNWRQFAASNRLQRGDKCIFELLSEENSSVIRVQILRTRKHE